MFDIYLFFPQKTGSLERKSSDPSIEIFCTAMSPLFNQLIFSDKIPIQEKLRVD